MRINKRSLAVSLVAFVATLLTAPRVGYSLSASEVSSPAACVADTQAVKKCSRWYSLSEKSDPDACKAARLSGEKCWRWYSTASAPKEVVVTLRGVNFDTASAKIRPDSYAILDQNLKGIRSKSHMSVRIEGHTDSRGEDAYNQKLSEARANSVMEYFVQHGIDRSRLTAVGKGESEPVGNNTTPDGQFQNRRIELHEMQ